MIQGQDWAGYQSTNPNVAGLDFVAIKVTQGLTYVNPHWHAQYDWAKGHGLAILLYHYPNMHNGAGTELQHFLSVARERPLAGVGLVLDWEGYDASNQGLSHADLAAYKEAWLAQADAVMPHNCHVLYCNVDYWRNVDATGHAGDGLWIADPNSPAGNPAIRAPWVMHQYGDAGGVDRDVANFPNRAALQDWLSHKETDMPLTLTPADADLVAQHVINATIPNPFRKDAKGESIPTPVRTFLAYGDAHYDSLHAQLTAVTAQLGALTAAVGALAKGGGLTAQEVQAAAEAGAQAALQQLGHALDTSAA